MITVTASLHATPERFEFDDVYVQQPNIGLVPAYQALYERHREDAGLTSAVVLYMHDDVTIPEQDGEFWAFKILAEFDNDPHVAIVGFGGAMGIGTDDIYKTPYRIQQLIRQDYYSNQTDWEIHGKRETGSRQVAVVDGFAMAVRTKFLDEIGGWSWMKTNFHCYDTAMCLMAARRGWKVRMVGVACTHHGGGTSITPEYLTFCRERGTTAEREHQEPHRWEYEKFRDVLPLRIGETK